MSTPHQSSSFVVAHRAGNHIHLLRRAERLGVELVEADVRLHRGRLEVRHLKSVGPLPIYWDCWYLANPFAPRLTLGALLDVLGPDTELMLDLKGRRSRVAELTRLELERRRTGRRVTVCSRNWHLLEQLSGLPDVRLVHSVGTLRQLRRFQRRVAERRLAGLSIHARLLDPHTVRTLRSRVDVIMSWPVNTPEHAHRLLDWGVHGLITDRPDEIAPVIDARQFRGAAA